MTHNQLETDLVSRFVSAVFTLTVTDEAGFVGLPAEVEALRLMARNVQVLAVTSQPERLLVDFARTTVVVVWGTQHDRRDSREWADLVELWRFQLSGLLAIPMVARLIPLPRDPSGSGPRFTEVHTDVDPIDAYSLTVAEEVRRAYKAGTLPDVA